MIALDIFASLLPTPVFWLVIGVLFLGLELINHAMDNIKRDMSRVVVML